MYIWSWSILSKGCINHERLDMCCNMYVPLGTVQIQIFTKNYKIQAMEQRKYTSTTRYIVFALLTVAWIKMEWYNLLTLPPNLWKWTPFLYQTPSSSFPNKPVCFTKLCSCKFALLLTDPWLILNEHHFARWHVL